MIYRIDFINGLGKPALKTFRTKVQANAYIKSLVEAGFPVVATSWERNNAETRLSSGLTSDLAIEIDPVVDSMIREQPATVILPKGLKPVGEA